MWFLWEGKWNRKWISSCRKLIFLTKQVSGAQSEVTFSLNKMPSFRRKGEPTSRYPILGKHKKVSFISRLMLTMCCYDLVSTISSCYNPHVSFCHLINLINDKSLGLNKDEPLQPLSVSSSGQLSETFPVWKITWKIVLQPVILKSLKCIIFSNVSWHLVRINASQ